LELFTQFLREVRRGMTEAELDDAMQEVIDEAMKTGKSASLTLTLKVDIAGEGQIAVYDTISTKMPQPSKGMSLFFIGENGRPTRTDPRQMELRELTEGR
jgi:hypothetical protein